MTLKFKIEDIKRSFRSKNEMKSVYEGASILFDEFIDAIDVQITITGLPSPCLGGDSVIKLHYVESYDPKSTFADFYARAEKFAKDYCLALGVIEKAA